MGGSDQWRLQKPLTHGRELVCLDLPGFGQNADMDPIDDIAGFARWALDELSAQGIEQFDLLGHSMGGMIVQEMVHLAPKQVRKLILYGTGSVGELPGRFESMETSMERATAEGAEATARRISATWFFDTKDAPEYEACAGIAQKATLDAILTGLRAMQKWSGANRLSTIQNECLIIWGDKDRTYNWAQVETLWKTIPDTRLAVVPDCAHAVHSEAPEIFNRIVDRFV